MKVKLVKYDKNAKQTVLAVFSLKDGEVVCEPEEWLKGMEPIRNYKENKIREWLTPKDGKKFLENMPYTFRNPYCMAMEVKDNA